MTYRERREAKHEATKYTLGQRVRYIPQDDADTVNVPPFGTIEPFDEPGTERGDAGPEYIGIFWPHPSDGHFYYVTAEEIAPFDEPHAMTPSRHTNTLADARGLIDEEVQS